MRQLSGLKGLTGSIFCLLSLQGQSLPQGIQPAETFFPSLNSLLDQVAEESVGSTLAGLSLEERIAQRRAARAGKSVQGYFSSRLVGAYETRDDIDDRFRGTLSANVNLVQPLVHWGNKERMIEIADQHVQVASAEYGRNLQDNLQGTRTAFLELFLIRENKEILSESVKLASRLLDVETTLVAEGVQAGQLLRELEARYFEKREQLAMMELNWTHWKERFHRHTGIPFQEGLLPAEFPSLSLPTESALKMIDPNQLPESRNTAKEIQSHLARSAAIQAEMHKRANLPKLDLIAGIFTDQLDSINQDNNVFRVQYFAGVKLDWHFFDGQRSDAQQAAALARKRYHEVLAEEQASSLESRWENIIASLQYHLSQISSRSTRESILNDRLAFLRRQKELDQVSGLALLEAELDYLEGKQRLLEAKVRYLVRASELYNLLGLDPRIPLNPSAS